MRASIILPADQLRRELELMSRSVEPPADQHLVCPPEEWIREFGRACVVRVPRPAPGVGNIEADDCDDVAGVVVELARQCRNRNLAHRDAGHGFAVMKARVRVALMENLNGIEGDGSTQHYTNIIRTPSEWVFFEGQTGLYTPALEALARGVADLLFVGV